MPTEAVPPFANAILPSVKTQENLLKNLRGFSSGKSSAIEMYGVIYTPLGILIKKITMSRKYAIYMNSSPCSSTISVL